MCGMGLPDTGARVEPVPIIHLLVLGEGDRLKPEWRPLALPTSPLLSPLLPSPPLPSPFLSAAVLPSLSAQCCLSKTPPQRGDGGGLPKGQTVITTPLYSFFFLQPTPTPAWIPPSFHGDCGAGRGAACYSEHGLSGFQICYCSFPRVEGGRLSP